MKIFNICCKVILLFLSEVISSQQINLNIIGQQHGSIDPEFIKKNFNNANETRSLNEYFLFKNKYYGSKIRTDSSFVLDSILAFDRLDNVEKRYRWEYINNSVERKIIYYYEKYLNNNWVLYTRSTDIFDENGNIYYQICMK